MASHHIQLVFDRCLVCHHLHRFIRIPKIQTPHQNRRIESLFPINYPTISVKLQTRQTQRTESKVCVCVWKSFVSLFVGFCFVLFFFVKIFLGIFSQLLNAESFNFNMNRKNFYWRYKVYAHIRLEKCVPVPMPLPIHIRYLARRWLLECVKYYFHFHAILQRYLYATFDPFGVQKIFISLRNQIRLQHKWNSNDRAITRAHKHSDVCVSLALLLRLFLRCSLCVRALLRVRNLEWRREFQCIHLPLCVCVFVCDTSVLMVKEL